MAEGKGDADDQAFEQLEADFAQVLRQLQHDPALDTFRLEYEKLHEALRKSHTSEKRLMAKCRELNAELVANAAKVQSVLQGSKEEDGTTAQLQKELEEAWKLVDQARANEARLKEQIEDLKEEINGLNAMIEDNAAQAEAKSEDMQELLAQRKALEVERDNQMELVARLRADVAEMTREQQQLLANKRTSDARAADLEEQLTARKNEAEREERRKGHLERELVMRKQDVEARQAEIDAQQDEIRLVQAEVEELQTLMESRNAELDRLSSELDEANMRNRKLEKQVEDSMMANQNAFEDNSRLQAELRASEDNVAQLRGESGKLQKLFETMQRKLRSSEETRAELTTQRDTLRGEIHALEREQEAAKRSSDNDRKRMEEMARTRELMTKKMMQAGRETEMQEALVRMHESTKKTLEAEIAGFREDNEQQRKQIAQLERDRDRNINEAATAQSKSLQALEDAKANEREIIDLKKRLADMDTKLRQQQSLYEQVRGDRNIYSKNLIEAQDEISEMKRKLKILNHQIDQLKEEITTKESHLQREHQSYELLEGQKIKLKSELDKYKAAAQRHERDIAAQQVEQDKLRKLVADADVECARQKTELEKVVRERDMLGTQLIRRNDELALVYEKLRIQQATLSRGEQQYRERLEDVRLLRMEIKRLRREKTVMTKSTSDVDDLQRELFQAQRELLRERTRCKALEDELQTPLNVHRWRKLEGSDPETFEMVQKIQTLQKRLIQKTEEVVERELQIQQREKQYLELKGVLARQPGPEVAEQLQLYQQTVKEKNRQLKSMASEVNMYQAQVGEYKYEIERLARELQDAKKKYFEQKKKEMLQRERERSLQGLPAMDTSGASRFHGGGFNATSRSEKELPV